MNSYFLCVTQPWNAGDLLINRMLIEELSLYGKVFVDCYNSPDYFRTLLIGHSNNIVDVYKEYGFTLKRGSILPFAIFLKQNRIGLYTQSPGPLNKYSEWSLRISFSIIRKTLSFFNVPFVRIGCCCSSAISTHTNVIESRNVQYYVRSKKGVEYLKSYRKYGIDFIPDLAFLYRYKVNDVLKAKKVIFSFREVTEEYPRFLQWLKDCITVLIHNEYEIIFYYQVDNDKFFMKKVLEQLNTDAICFRDHIVWYDDFNFYSDKTIVISNRLHSLLMGAVYNAIPYAYVDNGESVRKISDVFESVMGGDAVKFISNASDNTILLNILKNIEDYKKFVAYCVNENAEQCRCTIRRIIDSCKDDSVY